MALFSECRQSCARKELDTADIVRDGDVSTTRDRSSAAGYANYFTLTLAGNGGTIATVFGVRKCW
jgi:hypothetical protein